MAKLTGKNLEELSELLSSEDLAYKKCCNYIGDCSDAVLKSKLSMYAQNHKKRFDALLGYLNSHE